MAEVEPVFRLIVIVRCKGRNNGCSWSFLVAIHRKCIPCCAHIIHKKFKPKGWVFPVHEALGRQSGESCLKIKWSLTVYLFIEGFRVVLLPFAGKIKIGGKGEGRAGYQL